MSKTRTCHRFTFGIIFSVIAFAMPGSTLSFAQDSAVIGTYRGNVMFPGRFGETPLGLVVVIEAVEDGLVKANADYSTRGPCADRFPMEGKLQENKLTLREAKKFGRAGDCTLLLNLSVEGNKLVGKTGGPGHPVTLSK
jgi:hypothetical protein